MSATHLEYTAHVPHSIALAFIASSSLMQSLEDMFASLEGGKGVVGQRSKMKEGEEVIDSRDDVVSYIPL